MIEENFKLLASLEARKIHFLAKLGFYRETSFPRIPEKQN
jgi:hypothetical protein